ncbi:MAG TPA: hypothetical protein VIS10_08310 [Anaerolineales bacterium]
MVGWSVVAGLAIGQARVAETHRTPSIGVVTVGALPGVMVGWSVVAGLAVSQTSMAETR